MPCKTTFPSNTPAFYAAFCQGRSQSGINPALIVCLEQDICIFQNSYKYYFADY